jgi:hypothetical protein
MDHRPIGIFSAIYIFAPFAFSPSSTNLRMASERVTDSAAPQASIDVTRLDGTRAEINGSFPVAGRPRFLGCTFIDFFIS